MREIQQVCPEPTIFAVDSGEHTFFATHYLLGDGRDHLVGLYLYREAPFGQQEFAGLRDSLELLEGAVNSRWQERQKNAMANAPYRTDEGNLFLDRDRHVYMQSAGTAAILERAGLSIDAQGRLTVTSNNRAHIKLIADLLGGLGSPRRGVLDDYRGPYFVITVTPLPDRPQALGGEPSTFHMCIVDLWLEIRTSIERLCEVFPAFTVTEARVASWATYLSRKEIADKLDMSDRTVQVHMCRIYEKTGINQLKRATRTTAASCAVSCTRSSSSAEARVANSHGRR